MCVCVSGGGGDHYLPLLSHGAVAGFAGCSAPVSCSVGNAAFIPAVLSLTCALKYLLSLIDGGASEPAGATGPAHQKGGSTP